ncbi:MAG TPA: DbpA RNA binding domain-containing protein [Gemmatimonadales bacterium]|nr:DbpA RNA binding domain-containing protein [Gemmatimonadales bacterium]
MLDDARAALERGRPVVLVTPPEPEQARAVWDLVPAAEHGRFALIVCADHSTAILWGDNAPAERRVHVVTGLARSARVLREREPASGVYPPALVAGEIGDLAALVTRSVLKLESLAAIIVAWPESVVTSDHAATLDTVLAGAHGARRIILSWNPAELTDFLERQAHRAEIVGSLSVSREGARLGPVAPARYVIVPPERRGAAVRDVIDALDPRQPFVWPNDGEIPPAGTDLVICRLLPTRTQFAELCKAGPVTILTAPLGLSYLRSLAAPLEPVNLASEADRARDRGASLRARLTTLLEQSRLEPELALLDPLFERFDPALVAGAVLALQREQAKSGKGELSASTPVASEQRAKIFLNVGKKDKASAKDVVGALIREVGLAKGDIGRVDVRETFSIVELSAARVTEAVQALGRVTIRGRRVTARLDRYA